MIEYKLIDNIIRTDNISINQDSTISEAVEVMSKNREGLIVLLDKDLVTGILTERDLLELLRNKTELNKKIIDVAKKNVISINRHRTVEYALNILIDNNIRRLVIVNDDNQFIGIITQEMVISYLETEHYKVELKVSQVLSSLSQNIITMDVQSTLEDAVDFMYESGVGSILVTKNEKIVGIVTERDFVYLTSKKTALSTHLKDIMSRPVIHVNINDSIHSVVHIMDLKHIRRVLVNDDNGNTIGMIGTRDIIKNIKGNYGLYIETKLKYTKQVLNNINEVILEIYNNEYESLLIQWGNRSALSRYGDDIIDKPISTLVEKNSLSKILKELEQNGKVTNYKLDIGSYSYSVCINQSHSNQSILLVCKDITENIKLQEELREQKEIFQTLFQKSSDGALILKDRKFIDCNEAIIKMLKYKSKKDILNLHPSDLGPEYQPDGENSFQRANKMMQIVMRDGTNRFENYHTRADGENFWAEIVLTKITIDDKDFIYVVWRDIDERKKTELELEKLTKNLEGRVKEEIENNKIKNQQLIQQSRLAQMGEMISMIAHQWRQPLNAISLTSNNLQFKLIMDEIDNEYFKKEIALIDKYSQHLSKTIDDFRGFFKENKDRETITLEEIVNSTLDIVKTSIENKNIKVIIDFNSNVKFQTYTSEVRQVVLNIIKNAEDILLEKKIQQAEIIIQTETKEKKNILTIKDNAGGVPEDIMDKIFDPYFSTKKSKDGTGLGLYMSKTIIEEHCGGKLTISNDADGAVFKIEFII